MQKLKLGIIGTGLAFERLHYPALQKLRDQYEVVALCDVDPEKMSKWSNILQLSPEKMFQKAEDMLAKTELDVVDILVPIELNQQITELVAQKLAGGRKGIICEKPLAGSIREALKARSLPRQYNIPITIAENYRYNEEFDRLRDLVQEKKVGEPVYFIMNNADNFPGKMLKDTFQATDWRQHPEYPGGSFTDTAVHDLAGLRHIFGAVAKLQAFGRPQDADYCPYSVINVNLLFHSGVTGQYTFFASGKEVQKPLIGLRIFGTEGMLYLEDTYCGIINIFYNDGRHELVYCEPQKGYYNELLNFYNALTGLEPISVTPEMEFGDFKTVQDVLESIQLESIVNVDSTPFFVPDYKREEHAALQ